MRYQFGGAAQIIKNEFNALESIHCRAARVYIILVYISFKTHRVYLNKRCCCCYPRRGHSTDACPGHSNPDPV